MSAQIIQFRSGREDLLASRDLARTVQRGSRTDAQPNLRRPASWYVREAIALAALIGCGSLLILWVIP